MRDSKHNGIDDYVRDEAYKEAVRAEREDAKKFHNQRPFEGHKPLAWEESQEDCSLVAIEDSINDTSYIYMPEEHKTMSRINPKQSSWIEEKFGHLKPMPKTVVTGFSPYARIKDEVKK